MVTVNLSEAIEATFISLRVTLYRYGINMLPSTLAYLLPNTD